MKEGRIVVRLCWYSLLAFRLPPRKTKRTCFKAISSTKNHLRQAVHRQKVSDVPLGAFLFGGLDSSSVVAFARELNPNICCVTIELTGIGDEGFSDVLPYATRVASHLGLPLDIVQVDVAPIASVLEQIVLQLDEHLAGRAPLIVFFICQLAREQGIKVLLSGGGSDDNLSIGYCLHPLH